MPYIKQKDRDKLDAMMNLASVASLGPAPGPINYIITTVLKIYVGNHPNYERFNAAIGVLESAKLELYRRIVVPYEDEKLQENGDVYGIGRCV